MNFWPFSRAKKKDVPAAVPAEEAKRTESRPRPAPPPLPAAPPRPTDPEEVKRRGQAAVEPLLEALAREETRQEASHLLATLPPGTVLEPLLHLLDTPLRLTVSVALFGVQPTMLLRRVASANAWLVAASTAVWYCSTPGAEIDTVAALTLGKPPTDHESGSRPPIVTGPASRSRSELRNAFYFKAGFAF